MILLSSSSFAGDMVLLCTNAAVSRSISSNRFNVHASSLEIASLTVIRKPWIMRSRKVSAGLSQNRDGRIAMRTPSSSSTIETRRTLHAQSYCAFGDGALRSSVLERFKALCQPLGKDSGGDRQGPAVQLSKHEIGARKISVVDPTRHQPTVFIDHRADLDLERNRHASVEQPTQEFK